MSFSIVRDNLMNREGYSPYCGNLIAYREKGGCHNPRTKFNGSQFVCPVCGYTTTFPTEFIESYKERWKINK